MYKQAISFYDYLTKSHTLNCWTKRLLLSNCFVSSSLPSSQTQAEVTTVCDLAAQQNYKNCRIASRDQRKVVRFGSAGCRRHSQYGFWLGKCLSSPQPEGSGKVERKVPWPVSSSVGGQAVCMFMELRDSKGCTEAEWNRQLEVCC